MDETLRQILRMNIEMEDNPAGSTSSVDDFEPWVFDVDGGQPWYHDILKHGDWTCTMSNALSMNVYR